MADILHLVIDSGSLTSTEEAVKTYFEGLGHTVTPHTYNAAEVTAGHDLVLACTTQGFPVTAYGRDNPVPTMEWTATRLYWRGYWTTNTAVSNGGSAAAVDYDDDSGPFAWTDQALGSVTIAAASNPTFRYLASGAWGAGAVQMVSHSATGWSWITYYDEGEAMVGGNAAARKGTFVLENGSGDPWYVAGTGGTPTAAFETLLSEYVSWLAGEAVNPPTLVVVKVEAIESPWEMDAMGPGWHAEGVESGWDVEGLPLTVS